MNRSHGNFCFRLVVEQKRGENGADLNELRRITPRKSRLNSADCPTISTSSQRAAARHTPSGSCHFALMLWVPLEPRGAATCEG
jgi:hypothetical protein